MNLYAHVILQPWQDHPRDAFWFDLFSDAKDRDTSMPERQMDGELHISLDLPLEEAFLIEGERRKRPLSSSCEKEIIAALRENAKMAASTSVEHALRCLATCLENYARYGCEDALARVVSLAYHLHLNHSSSPYRLAFGEAHNDLVELVRQYRTFPEAAPGNTSNQPFPDKVFYFAVLNSSDQAMPRIRIRLFQHETEAVNCMTEWLRQYGIPYEVWRSLRGVMADELLPYQQDGLFATVGERDVLL